MRQISALTPRMLRVVFTGPDLQGFNIPSPDDHIKLFFPSGDGNTEKRDYTPRSFDLETLSLTVDFATHTGGIGSDWARQAKPGDTLQIGGPRGSTVIQAEGAWWLLVGDETALPSIARRLEELPAGTPVSTYISIADADERQVFSTATQLTEHWLVRRGGSGADALCEEIAAPRTRHCLDRSRS